ncbi:hypothetical protein ACSSS7_005933 [Eimeria intestinalis]
MTRICALVGFACAVAASYTASAEPLPEEAPVAHLADVSNEEEEGVTVEMEGDDVVIGVPTFEGFEVKEVGPDGTEREVEELGGDFADGEEEGAEKRELHLCYKKKCKKMKYKKGKHYKLKKHYKKGKKYGSYSRPAVAAVPMKEAQPAVVAVPMKVAAQPMIVAAPTKAAAPMVASVPTKGYSSSTPAVVSYSAPTFRSSVPSKGYATRAALPQVASYQSVPIKATYMPQLASFLPASSNGGSIAGSNPSTNYLMQRANSVASAASAPSYKVVDNTNLLQRLIVQPASFSASQGQKGQ